jgi:hypothetical protein
MSNELSESPIKKIRYERIEDPYTYAEFENIKDLVIVLVTEIRLLPEGQLPTDYCIQEHDNNYGWQCECSRYRWIKPMEWMYSLRRDKDES